MRIAWLGPTPQDHGGVSSMAGQVVLGLAEAGAQVEMFLEEGSELLDRLVTHPGIDATLHPTNWEFDRWYSSTSLTKLLTGTGARVRMQRRLADALVRRHAAAPFDVVYRLSQIELLALRRSVDRLPPMIFHPEVHAQAERDFHWRERGLARRAGEHPGHFAATHAYLAYRSVVQRRDIHRAARVVAPSVRFGALLHRDYGVSPGALRVLPNAIDLERFTPGPATPAAAPEVVHLLFVSRMSVRKGVEQVVRLSHRLDDLVGQVHIRCIGGASLFSDYRGLLDDLNPRVASYDGPVDADVLAGTYRQAHAALQPSRYEPFALTVAEALASGLPVVVSDEVGAGERLDPVACRVFAADDEAEMEREVRALVGEIQRGAGPDLAAAARTAAEERFGRRALAAGLLEVIGEVVDGSPR